MSLEVKIEIRSIVVKQSEQPASADTHAFNVFVRGLNGNQIQHFVKEVVFYMPSNSKQVKRKPPYAISGSTSTSFRLPIELFLHTVNGYDKIRYSYYVFIPDKPAENAAIVKTLTFLNTPQDFKEKLLLGGAEEVDQQANSSPVVTQIKKEPVETIENHNEIFENVVEAKSSEEAAPNEGTSIQNEIQDQLENTCVENKTIPEQKGSFVIQGVYSFGEFLKENEELKKENETFCENSRNLKQIIANYTERFPGIQNDLAAISMKVYQMNEKVKVNDAEISSMKSSLQMLMTKMIKGKIKAPNRQRKRLKTSSASFHCK